MKFYTFFFGFVIYAIDRFILEFFRGDHVHFWEVPGLDLSLTMSQRVCVITFPIAVIGFLVMTWKGRIVARHPDGRFVTESGLRTEPEGVQAAAADGGEAAPAKGEAGAESAEGKVEPGGESEPRSDEGTSA